MATPQMHEIQREPTLEVVQMPAPTAWPIVLAFGITMLFAGLVTTAAISILGAVLALAGTVGWFRDVLPHEQHEWVKVVAQPVAIASSRREVARVPVAEEHRRAFLPLETYPVSAGIKGGIAGGIAMAIVAMAYGVISQHGIWYPINLLAAIVYARGVEVTASQMEAFHFNLLLVALAIHAVTSLMVGLVYGAILPMLPRNPILLGGIFTPLLWSGLLYNMLEYVNPVLSQRVNWPWFVASQIVFGVVAGVVVTRQEKIRTLQQFPFEFRAGIETPGVMREKKEKGE
jgi:hypothetical protein